MYEARQLSIGDSVRLQILEIPQSFTESWNEEMRRANVGINEDLKKTGMGLFPVTQYSRPWLDQPIIINFSSRTISATIM